MRRLALFLLVFVAALATRAIAQSTGGATSAPYAFAGRIEYERKTNLHRQIEGEEWYEKFKAQIPKFNTAYFDLLFNATTSLYKPGREPENPNPFARNLTGPAAANTVHTNFGTGRVAAAKEVFEQKYLVEDSMRRLRWKVLEEVRTIAGYPCRKAVSRMFDSVVVVAFYADGIPVSGGPESFAGLPGMILEVAIPRLHTTWIATKVELTTPDAAQLAVPTKGKKTDTKGLVETLQASLKDWGKWASKNVWWCVI
jgi:GLPGLI family protein